MQPKRNYHEAKLIYFISFLLLVGFFVLNMFVGVVVENFHKCRAEQEREEKARRTAKRAKKIERKRRRMREVPYYAHFSPWRRRLHDVCNSKYFDLIIAAVIGLNVVTMSLEFYLMPPVIELHCSSSSFIFFRCCVSLNIDLRLGSGLLQLRVHHGIRLRIHIENHRVGSIALLQRQVSEKGDSSTQYTLLFFSFYSSRWNQLDTTIVVLSIAGIVMERMKSGHILPINPTLIRVMRVMRIARGKNSAQLRTLSSDDGCTILRETRMMNMFCPTLYEGKISRSSFATEKKLNTSSISFDFVHRHEIITMNSDARFPDLRREHAVEH